MNVGDLIYDSVLRENGMVIEVSKSSSYMTVLYEDGDLCKWVRTSDPEIKVLNEVRLRT